MRKTGSRIGVCATLLVLLAATGALVPASLAQAAGSASSASAQTGTASGTVMATVSASAGNAEHRCNDLGHDNLDEYVSCTDALFKAVKGKNGKATQERLGILYFGWVGAEHWLRVGLPGAQEAAVRYFRLYRPLQRELGLSDQTLCAALAGDCTVRVAQVAAAVKEYGAAPATGSAAGQSAAGSAAVQGKKAGRTQGSR